jgi:hypothetical protein
MLSDSSCLETRTIALVVGQASKMKVEGPARSHLQLFDTRHLTSCFQLSITLFPDPLSALLGISLITAPSALLLLSFCGCRNCGILL